MYIPDGNNMQINEKISVGVKRKPREIVVQTYYPLTK